MRRVLRQLVDDTRGATAIMFGLTLVMLMMAIGVAFDSARLFNVSEKVRGALDASALAAAKLLDVDTASDSDVRDKAAAYFDTYRSRIGQMSATLSNFSLTTNRTDGTVTASVNVNYETAFGRLISISNVNFSPSATVLFKAKKIELALVLDVTGSMGDDGKIGALKTAARDLLDILNGSNPEPGAVKVGIVPYAGSVNVGSYYAATTNLLAGADTCVVERGSMPGAVGDDPPGPGRWAGTSSYADNDRYGCPAAAIQPILDLSLPANKTSLETQIDALNPDGWTAGHIGAAWGWYMVSHNWQSVWPPQSQPRSPSPSVLKAVLLMTDGMFNTAYFGGNMNGSDPTVPHSSGDQTLQLCQNMRDAGILVFTVAFDAPTEAEDLLRTCAGSVSNAFTASSPAELSAMFRSIGERLSMLRLAK